MTAAELADLLGRIEKLEDIEAAQGFFHTYAKVLDDPDADTVVRLFAPDALIETPAGPIKGAAAIREFFARAFAADPSVKRHFVVNPRATWLSPGRVRVEAYFLYTGRGVGASVIGWGTYDDVIDVRGLEPLFVKKAIDVHLGTDLDRGWSLQEVTDGGSA